MIWLAISLLGLVGFAVLLFMLCRVAGARVAILRSMWGHYSAGLIAERLGTTRNAIIGKADRIGLRGPGPLASSKMHNRLPPDEKAARKRKKSAIYRFKKTHPAPVAEPATIAPPQPLLSGHPCLWPTSADRPYTFCGAPSLRGRPYCPEHCERASAGKPPPTGRQFV